VSEVSRQCGRDSRGQIADTQLCNQFDLARILDEFATIIPSVDWLADRSRFERGAATARRRRVLAQRETPDRSTLTIGSIVD
jgi:hypothetical protein